MKRYCDYMDSVELSPESRARLAGLTAPKRTAAWKRYGAMAAALVVAVGVGAWALSERAAWSDSQADCSRGEEQDAAAEAVLENFSPAVDIAVVEPSDVEPDGMKTIGGYEVRGEDLGPETPVSYYVLPYIEYGMVGAAVALDWDIPAGAARRDLTGEEITALLGGADAVSTHLNWSGYDLTGWAAWYEDGSFWGVYLYGYAGELDHFEFAVCAGALPPTCIGFAESVENDIWGVTVTADGYDSDIGYTRRVSFMSGGYGCRFDLTGTDREQAEELVSRAVRRMVVDGGLELSAVGPDGLEFPVSAPGFSVGEPNWEDQMQQLDPADGAGEEDGDGVLMTQPFDPGASDTNS